MATEIPWKPNEESHNSVPGHGLWYVTRDGKTIYRLDAEPDSIPSMPASERYVMRATIDYTLDKLDKYQGDR